MSEETAVLALCGNPNVGKSTLFNALTGLRQHTGNWPGKTVGLAEGECRHGERNYRIVDLPGTYSLFAHSKEEEIARDFIEAKNADAAIVICDATCLERGLNLAMQVMSRGGRTVICVNLMDEAEKRGISVDIVELERLMGVPAAGISARAETGLDGLFEAIERALDTPEADKCDNICTGCADCPHKAFCIAENIVRACVEKRRSTGDEKQLKIDKVLTGKYTAIPIMLILLAIVFYITLEGANYPSQWLSALLFRLEKPIHSALCAIGLPEVITAAVSKGAYRVLAWVVSVMLPPMAIFFPLFTFLEELGYLPRAAFNMDNAFKKSGACGKQALTMLMGLGCNAAAAVGCRIIDSPRERIIALVTNCFMPCNGRFPALIAVLSMFFAFSGALGGIGAALLLTGLIVLGVLATLLSSRLLSITILKGQRSSFTLELPPFRAPRIGRLIVRSVLDRTLFVLGRAAAVAAPAGLIIYILANVSINGATLLSICTELLEPVGRVIGLDGTILISFVLGFPANEIVLPIAIMAYTASGSLESLPALNDMRELLVMHGWSIKTAVCFLIFCLMHWPCSTTLMTIKKETGSIKWTLLAFALPTVLGFVMCLAANMIMTAVGL